MSEPSPPGLFLSQLSLVVAAASAAFAGGTFFIAQDQLRQQRDAALLEQRVQACVLVDARAQDVQVSGSHARLAIEVNGRTSDEGYRAIARISSDLSALNDAGTLDLLGPQSLADAESRVSLAATDVLLAFSRPEEPITEQSVRDVTEALFQARMAFKRECQSTLGAFRTVSP